MLAGSLERVVEEHIGVERIVLGTLALLGDRIIEGCRHLGLLGEELAQFQVGGKAGVELVVGAALIHAFLETAEAIRLILAGNIDGAEVGQLHIEVALCGPSALIVIFLESELIDPHLARLGVGREVAHTDNHGLHLTERGVTHHADAVGRIVLIVGGEEVVVGGVALSLGLVALLLHGGEHGKGYIEHVLLRPHDALVVGRVFVVVSRRGELEGHLILIVVALVVAAQAHEHRQLVVGQIGGIVDGMVGMHEHLQAAVLAQVEVGVLEHSLRLAGAQVAHHHVEGLLVALHQLRLCGVLHTRDARRQDVVDRFLVVVLLDVDSAHRHIARVGGAVGEVLGIDAPLAAHQVETAEAEHDGFLESGKEHAHEAYGGEVVDGAHPLLKLVEGDTELIPGHVVVVAVAQGTGAHAAVYDEVLSHHEVFRTDGDVILVVFLILIEGEVLVDVLHIGGGLVRGVVALGARVGVGRIALRVVDALVAVLDSGLYLVEVGAAEVVVVVVGGVVHDTVEHLGGHLSLDGGEELLVRIERAFLLVGEAVEAHILPLA